MSNYEIFHQLHYRNKPVIIGNAWNAYSAQLFEKNGFKAIGTSSGAIASSLGFEDGEKISFDDLLFVVAKIISVIKAPLTVDLETGFGSTAEKIVDNLERLSELGVVGVNIEDSVRGNSRELIPVDVFSKKLNDIKSGLLKKNIKMFINARTDGYLMNLPSPLAITLERIRAYENSGADGIFVIFLKEEESIKKITASTSLPINVVSMPGLPSFESLTEWGIRRISLGSAVFRASYKKTDELIKGLIKDQSVEGLF
ncbi:MAG: isocitrate lyase/phosphoenolpyruvate mutase family protein [Bacteroidetes bacterium]|nr:isocitrate lyase/phosphoenolpyruvate mutase family protein [Bacteroidota bacterium]